EAGEIAPPDVQAPIAPGEVQVGAAAGGEIVEHADAIALGEQTLDEVRADEARSAGDEGKRWCGHGVRDALDYGGRPRALSMFRASVRGGRRGLTRARVVASMWHSREPATSREPAQEGGSHGSCRR